MHKVATRGGRVHGGVGAECLFRCKQLKCTCLFKCPVNSAVSFLFGSSPLVAAKVSFFSPRPGNFSLIPTLLRQNASSHNRLSAKPLHWTHR